MRLAKVIFALSMFLILSSCGDDHSGDISGAGCRLIEASDNYIKDPNIDTRGVLKGEFLTIQSTIDNGSFKWDDVYDKLDSQCNKSRVEFEKAMELAKSLDKN